MKCALPRFLPSFLPPRMKCAARGFLPDKGRCRSFHGVFWGGVGHRRRRHPHPMRHRDLRRYRLVGLRFLSPVVLIPFVEVTCGHRPSQALPAAELRTVLWSRALPAKRESKGRSHIGDGSQGSVSFKTACCAGGQLLSRGADRGKGGALHAALRHRANTGRLTHTAWRYP